MDKTVPIAAAYILDFIASIEAPKGYDTIYGNNQKKLKKRITSMTLGELLDAQKSFTAQYKSSASGRYQFMRATLAGLINELKLNLNAKFTPDLQDRLAYHLLRRRGYDAFMFGKISIEEFAKRLAMEWASLPVLAGTKNYKNQNISRGTSYYAGDGLNKELVSASAFQSVLMQAHNLHVQSPAAPEVKDTTVRDTTIGGVAATVPVVVGGAVAVGTDTVNNATPYLDALQTLGKYGPAVVATVVTALFVTVAVRYIWSKWK